ncbi:MAG: GAF domain-containing protein [Sandaracinus sp.]|nr:GAF domain-containing protein [Sandaracinus sp.]
MVVSDLGGDAVRAELTVESDNWMSALRKGRGELGEQGGVPTGSSCAVASDGTVTILDPVERRRFTLAPAPASVRPPGGLRIPADEVPRPQSSPPPRPSSYVPPPPSSPPPAAAPKKVGKQTVAYIPAGAIPAPAPVAAPVSPVSPVSPASAPPAQVSPVVSPASAPPSPVAPAVASAPPGATTTPETPRKKPAKMTVAYLPGAEALTAPVSPPAPMAPNPVAPAAPPPEAPAPAPAAPVSAAPAAPAPASAKKRAKMTMAYLPGDVALPKASEVVVGTPSTPAPAPVATPAPTPEPPEAVPTAASDATVAEAAPNPEVTDRHAAVEAEPSEIREGTTEGVTWSLLVGRDADPTAENPLCYRERSYLVPEGTPGEVAEAIARARVEEQQAILAEAPPGRFVNVAVFDHAWADRPQRPPAATAQWKDWQGDVAIDRPLERWLASQAPTPSTPAPAPAPAPVVASPPPSTPAPEPSAPAPSAPAPAPSPPEAPAVVVAAEPVPAPRTRRTTDDHDQRLADAFEACQDLFFLGSPVEGLEFAVELLGQLVPHEAASACLYDIDEDVLRFVVANGPGADEKRSDAVPASVGLFGIAVRMVGSALRVDPLGTDPRYDPGVDGRFGLEPENALYLPVVGQGRILGVLQLINREIDVTFSQGDADLGLYVAEQLGKFLQQVRLRPRR